MDGGAERVYVKRAYRFSFVRGGVYVLLLLPFLLIGVAPSFLGSSPFGLPLVALFCFSAAACLFRFYELRMRRSVAALVKARLERLGGSAAAAALQDQVRRLHACLEEQRQGYELQLAKLEAAFAQGQSDLAALNDQMDRKLEEMRIAYLEYEDMRKEYERLEEEFSRFRVEVSDIQENKDAVLSEYQHTIAQQRLIIEKKQLYIGKLEGKVRDLMYEIRSLLQLEEPPVSPTKPPILDLSEPPSAQGHFEVGRATTYDYSVKLSHYIELAERFTGVDHLGYVGGKSPRFLDTTMDTYTIDLRRLFDVFRDETGCVLFVFSQAKDQILFVNPFVKTALGWSPEKVMKDFPELITEGYQDWLGLQKKLYENKEIRIGLCMRARGGEEIPFHCHMGLVSRGPFLNHAIGLLAPDA